MVAKSHKAIYTYLLIYWFVIVTYILLLKYKYRVLRTGAQSPRRCIRNEDDGTGFSKQRKRKTIFSFIEQLPCTIYNFAKRATYEKCILIEHPCIEHDCPVGMECFVYGDDKSKSLLGEASCRYKELPHLWIDGWHILSKYNTIFK